MVMALNPFCCSAYYKYGLINSKCSNPKYNLGCNLHLTDCFLILIMFASQTEVCISVRIQSSAATLSSTSEGRLNLEYPWKAAFILCHPHIPVHIKMMENKLTLVSRSPFLVSRSPFLPIVAVKYEYNGYFAHLLNALHLEICWSKINMEKLTHV